MKTIQLTPREFYNFKSIAHFVFNMVVVKQIVYIEADAIELAKLGY
jgi:hypothetical protein